MVRISASILIGLLYVWLAAGFWNVYGDHNAIDNWLIEVLASDGYPMLFRIARLVHELLVNVLIAAPFAGMLISVKRLNAWVHVVAASIAAVVFINWGALSLSLLDSVGFWTDSATMALCPVLAFAGFRALKS